MFKKIFKIVCLTLTLGAAISAGILLAFKQEKKNRKIENNEEIE